MNIIVVRETIFQAYHAGLGGGLHGDLGVGVGLEASIKDAIRNLIAELIGVTLADGFGSEVDVVVVGVESLGFSHCD